MRGLFLTMAMAVGALALPATAKAAGEVDCEMRFTVSSWSAFYKAGKGSGTITCNNGQTLAVSIRTRGGGLTFGKSTIDDGIGEFSGVDDISELLGTYASAEAHAGAVKSAKGQVVTKGEVSLALAGKGRGWDLGVAFGKFQIKRR
ncbi:MAG: hypothetical protein R3F22_09450 [Lysobacteraceae bacterium]